MVRRTYVGVVFPESEFRKLEPAYRHLRAMQLNCKPLSPEYNALQRACEALRETAQQLTGDPYFYGGRPHSS